MPPSTPCRALPHPHQARATDDRGGNGVEDEGAAVDRGRDRAQPRGVDDPGYAGGEARQREGQRADRRLLVLLVQRIVLIAAASDMSWPQLDYRRTIPKT